MDRHQLAHPPRGRRAGVGGGLDRAHVAPHLDGDERAAVNS
jgi:hypothetical protein